MLSEIDQKLLKIAYEEAKEGFEEGGCPIGSVLARDGKIIAQGRNQRVQKGDPIAHGEMDALRKAGRQKTYKDTVLYTSLSPCMMCSGTIRVLEEMKNSLFQGVLRYLLLMIKIVYSLCHNSLKKNLSFG